MPDRNAIPWRRTSAGLELRVRLTPKGGRDAVDGLTETPDGPALKARVRAAPEDGEANAALVGLVARWLDVAKRNVTVVSGHKSRTKVLRLAEDASPSEGKMRELVEALSAPVEKAR